MGLRLTGFLTIAAGLLASSMRADLLGLQLQPSLRGREWCDWVGGRFDMVRLCFCFCCGTHD
jgi:hypothetical protein